MGRGKNTGLNADDGITIELMDNEMWNLTLHTYNKLSDTADLLSTKEFHGDLHAELKQMNWS
jgi:hypothetical protein